MYLRNLIRGTRLLHLGAAVLLSIGVTAATAAPVDKTGAGPAAISQTAKPAEKFNGQPIYAAALDALQKSHRELRDPAVRAKFIATWQNKHDTDGMLDTEAGTDRAILEMVWSLGQRFDYYNPPVAAKAEADRYDNRALDGFAAASAGATTPAGAAASGTTHGADAPARAGPAGGDRAAYGTGAHKRPGPAATERRTRGGAGDPTHRPSIGSELSGALCSQAVH